MTEEAPTVSSSPVTSSPVSNSAASSSKLYAGFKNFLNKDFLMAVLPYRELKFSRDEWNSQYASGSWNVLNGISELAHYSVIAGYHRIGNVHGKVLDIGCGSGQLFEHLQLDPKAQYVGIDISDEAIAAAQEFANESTSFLQTDAESYEPDENFDSVIFNECLYYFDDPVSVVKRYAEFMNPGGDVIVSMFRSRRSKRVWQALAKAGMKPLDSTTVSNSCSTTWTIKLFRFD